MQVTCAKSKTIHQKLTAEPINSGAPPLSALGKVDEAARKDNTEDEEEEEEPECVQALAHHRSKKLHAGTVAP